MRSSRRPRVDYADFLIEMAGVAWSTLRICTLLTSSHRRCQVLRCRRAFSRYKRPEEGDCA